MDSSKRICTQLPLQELWDRNGPVEAELERPLGKAELHALTHRAPLRLVVAEIGESLNWISEPTAQAFLKHEVQPHLANPDGDADSVASGSDYYYRAYEWVAEESAPIVVLEMHHRTV